MCGLNVRFQSVESFMWTLFYWCNAYNIKDDITYKSCMLFKFGEGWLKSLKNVDLLILAYPKN